MTPLGFNWLSGTQRHPYTLQGRHLRPQSTGTCKQTRPSARTLPCKAQCEGRAHPVLSTPAAALGRGGLGATSHLRLQKKPKPVLFPGIEWTLYTGAGLSSHPESWHRRGWEGRSRREGKGDKTHPGPGDGWRTSTSGRWGVEGGMQLCSFSGSPTE